MAEIPGYAGRMVKIYKGDEAEGTPIISRTKTVTVNNESIDVTSDTDDGFRTLLAEASVRSIDIQVEGVIRQNDFLTEVLTPASTGTMEQYTLVIPQIGTISGNFRFSTVEQGAPYDDAATFSMTIESSGEWTFTPEGD